MFKHGLLLLCLLMFSQAITAENPLRDPTRPYSDPNRKTGEPEVSQVDLILRSVLISPYRRVAIINSSRVVEGDWVEDAQVTQIEKGRVRLIRQGKPITLTLPSGGIKRLKTVSKDAQT